LTSATLRVISRSREEIIAEFKHLGVDPAGIRIMSEKATFHLLKVDHLKPQAAIILKQESLSAGAETAVPRDTINLKEEYTSAIIMGTEKQLRYLQEKLNRQPFGLSELAKKLESFLKHQNKRKHSLRLGNYSLPLGSRTLVMGVVNVTPDSFSDGGKFVSVNDALKQAQNLVEEGADIIDLGGESTRPGAVPVSEEEELKRVMPVLKALKSEVNAPVSIDTYKASVAEKALQEGATMINDVWGFKADKNLASVAAQHEVPVCLMHNREKAEYHDLMGELVQDLRESIDLALSAGVKENNIIIDPGIGFGKTTGHNLEVMKRLEELQGLGYPILLGTSRKSLIGNVLQLSVDERLEGTAATVCYGITRGVDLVRVHDVKFMKRICTMTDAMLGS